MKTRTLAALVAAFSMAGAAQAATVTYSIANVSATIDGNTSTTSNTPTAYESQTQSGQDFGASVTAFQNVSGFSQLSLDVTSYDAYGSFAADGMQHDLSAYAGLGLTFTNTGSVAEYGTFSFSLSGLQLHTFNAGGNTAEAELSFYAITSSGDSYSASMGLRGDYNAPELFNVDNFSGSPVESNCYMDTCYEATVDIAGVNDALTLGLLNPGDSVNVQLILSASASMDGAETGAEVMATDPDGYFFWSYEGRPIDTTPNPSPSEVPLPPSIALGLTGLALLRMVGRKGRQA